MSYDAVDYTTYGDFFVVGGTTMVPKLFDDNTFQCVVELKGENATEIKGHSNWIYCTKFNPFDNNLIVSGGWDNCVVLYDVR